MTPQSLVCAYNSYGGQKLHSLVTKWLKSSDIFATRGRVVFKAFSVCKMALKKPVMALDIVREMAPVI